MGGVYRLLEPTSKEPAIAELEVKMIEYIGKGFRKIVVYPRGGSISRT
jgi:hypothetical protein